LLNFEEGKVMNGTEKVKSFGFSFVALALVLCALVLWLSGCGYAGRSGKVGTDAAAKVLTLGSKPETYAQLGETEAEGRRRHLRNARINRQELMADLDTLLLLDEPSRLTDRRIP
jgi:hypothetical protein